MQLIFNMVEPILIVKRWFAHIATSRWRIMTLALLAAVAGLNVPATQGSAKSITDQLGRDVAIPASPRRIVSLAPSITEIVFDLGQGHRLVGVTRYSDHPARAAKLPKVGSYVRLDIERIVALNPDLCLATKDGNPKSVINRLASLKIPVYVVNPHNLDAILETILEIGMILDAGDKAAILTRRMQNRIQRVKSRVSQVENRPRVFVQIGVSPIVSAGTDTFIHELIKLAGGQNLAEGRVAYPRFSREQVLALEPEIFIITSMARQAAFEQVKAEWRRWPNMPAVRNERIYLVDSDLFDRPSPRLVTGLEILARLIHPELED